MARATIASPTLKSTTSLPAHRQNSIRLASTSTGFVNWRIYLKILKHRLERFLPYRGTEEYKLKLKHLSESFWVMGV